MLRPSSAPPKTANSIPITRIICKIHDPLMATLTRFPKLSIVTPSYNQGRYLKDTICSILDQGYPNLEYIIMDGGSTDESVEIIKKYERHLAYWQSEKDRGQNHAITEGFKHATGVIYAYLNSDDKYL